MIFACAHENTLKNYSISHIVVICEIGNLTCKLVAHINANAASLFFYINPNMVIIRINWLSYHLTYKLDVFLIKPITCRKQIFNLAIPICCLTQNIKVFVLIYCLHLSRVYCAKVCSKKNSKNKDNTHRALSTLRALLFFVSFTCAFNPVTKKTNASNRS